MVDAYERELLDRMHDLRNDLQVMEGKRSIVGIEYQRVLHERLLARLETLEWCYTQYKQKREDDSPTEPTSRV